MHAYRPLKACLLKGVLSVMNGTTSTQVIIDPPKCEMSIYLLVFQGPRLTRLSLKYFLLEFADAMVTRSGLGAQL